MSAIIRMANEKKDDMNEKMNTDLEKIRSTLYRNEKPYVDNWNVHQMVLELQYYKYDMA
jgi:hypothetical protein